MGNEKSQPVGMVIEKNALQADNFWTMHNASFGGDGGNKAIVFIGSTESGSKATALENFSKNIMLNRHPNILKYVSSWRVSGQYHLATEEVRPLSHVISQQTPLQLCIGLNNILKAVAFLHDKALSSHNNLCQAAIYVTPEGQWKLGGMEYLCKFSDLSSGFLAESRQGRYDRGICPSEETRVPQPPSAIDQFAYGVFVEECLLPRVTDEVPGMVDFLEICRRQLQATECSVRPPLSQLLQHSFFNHQFISIYSFLSELPLKSEGEKQAFFRDLSQKLCEYNEETVASQLGGLLLSRMVLLDSTAQQYLLPQLLNPRNGSNPDCIFSEKVFRETIAPRLLGIFCVRDAHIRLTLLGHFQSFCASFNEVQLQSRVLPELLVGIKDTNDKLVAATLHALAELVPLLGSSTVIGGKRGKLFSDGRPKALKASKSSLKKTQKTVKPSESFLDVHLTERPSPDGGEAPSTGTLTEDESEPWDNWDLATPQLRISTPPPVPESEENSLQLSTPTSPAAASATDEPLKKLDISSLEVKKMTTKVEELDFFSDMEPVISKPCILNIEEISKKFEVSNDAEEDGWVDDQGWADDGSDPLAVSS